MSDLLSIGASGVRAYQTALNTVSENIANTGVAGFTRRTTNLSEVTGTGSGLNASVANSAKGVIATGLSRSADPFRALAVRTASADLSRTETGAAWLGRIESALTGNKLGDRLTRFYTATQALAADPTSLPARSVMLEAAAGAAAAFTASGNALDTAAADLDATARQATQSLNAYGTALVKVNDGLARSQPGSATTAQLLDQRDQLLEQMSAITDINAQFDDLGRATVRLGSASGPEFVAGLQPGIVSYVRNDEGAVSFAVQRAGTTAAVSPSGGALAGVADGAQRIAAARQSLNAIATQFTTQVNTAQTNGRDLNGVQGVAMFAIGATPTDITLTAAMDDPRLIAAAGADGGARDSSNLTALLATRTASGSEAQVTSLVTANAAALEQKKLVADAQGAIRDGAVAARDSQSSVNLDTEAVELLRFQQAYQASSRVIQTARDVLQTILDIR